MLGTYSVNGRKSEMLVDQDALVWWPSSSKRGDPDASGSNSNKSSQLSSPVRHLKRLSSGDKEIESEKQRDRKRRQVEFDQIIGVVRVARGRKRAAGLKSNSASDHGKQATECDEIKQTEATRQSSSETSGPASSSIIHRLKIYYAKRSETKSTGRLIKLKKITISSRAHETRATTLERNLTPSSSSTDSCPNSSAQRDPLGGLLEHIEQHLELKRRQRPRRLLVFVNPFGGKGKALHLYKSRVRKIFQLAQVECQLVVTKYANHARDTIEDPLFALDQFDGIICIGGDGMFAELMNGLLFRFNREKMLSNELRLINKRLSEHLVTTATSDRTGGLQAAQPTETESTDKSSARRLLKQWRSQLGGVGEPFQPPNIPIGVIGAGSTDANLFGFIGTNDTVSATLNIILGNQIHIDVTSIHSIEDDRLLRFVSTFVAYGYFGDVIRESEKLRWLGPSRYDVTALNSLIKYRSYNGLVRILCSRNDGTPLDTLDRCHLNCGLCRQTTMLKAVDNPGENNNHLPNLKLEHSMGVIEQNFERGISKDGQFGDSTKTATTMTDANDEFEIIETEGAFMGVNAAVTACRCPQTRKGFSPGNHLANGCADLILVRECSRIQYINYLIRTGFTSKSAFDLGFVDAYRCRQFEFVVQRAGHGDWNNTEHSDAAAISDHETATSDYQSKTSTEQSSTTCIMSIASSGDGSNANTFDSKQFAADYEQKRAQILNGMADRSNHSDEAHVPASDDASSWNVDGEILHEQSIRVKVNNKLLRVFGTGEPQPKMRHSRRQRSAG